MSVIVATHRIRRRKASIGRGHGLGQDLATGTPTELTSRTARNHLEDAFIQLRPEAKRRGHRRSRFRPGRRLLARRPDPGRRADQRFGASTAVDHVELSHRAWRNFRLHRLRRPAKTTTTKTLDGAASGQRRQSAAVRPRRESPKTSTRASASATCRSLFLFTGSSPCGKIWFFTPAYFTFPPVKFPAALTR